MHLSSDISQKPSLTRIHSWHNSLNSDRVQNIISRPGFKCCRPFTHLYICVRRWTSTVHVPPCQYIHFWPEISVLCHELTSDPSLQWKTEVPYRKLNLPQKDPKHSKSRCNNVDGLVELKKARTGGVPISGVWFCQPTLRTIFCINKIKNSFHSSGLSWRNFVFSEVKSQTSHQGQAFS